MRLQNVFSKFKGCFKTRLSFNKLVIGIAVFIFLLSLVSGRDAASYVVGVMFSNYSILKNLKIII